jgi:hypothetical protein
VTVAAGTASAVARPGLDDVLARRPASTLDRALVDLASCALLACAVWMWASATLAVVEAVRRRPDRWPEQRAARGVRRWVLAACGVAALSGPLSPAAADHGTPAGGVLPYPDRAVAPSGGPPGRAHLRVVVVRPGDSLWAIARRDLGPAAGDAAVDARWRAVYAANRRLVGPDPDVLVPGLRLLLPGKDPS